MDFFILVISYLEIVLSNTSQENAYYVRFITSFKTLRVFRLLKANNFLTTLYEIISKSISSYIYLLVLLFLFNFVYTIIGMQLFGGTFKRNPSLTTNFSYDTFWSSYLTTFTYFRQLDRSD